MGTETHRSYDRFNNFRARVLDPAIEAINDFGTVTVKMTLEKRGRSIHAIRFDWRWKDPHDASQTATENDRHSVARRKQQEINDAPPMIEDHHEAARLWWDGLPEDERNTWSDYIGRETKINDATVPRPERIIRQMAFKESGQPLPPFPVKKPVAGKGSKQ